MKGGFLLTEDPQFFETAKDHLVSRGALFVVEVGAVQIGGSGDDIFTLYNSAEPEWEFRLGPFTLTDGVLLPDMSVVLGFAIECNSEEFFARIVREIAPLSGMPSWVLDGYGVVWAAHEVDPTAIRL